MLDTTLGQSDRQSLGIRVSRSLGVDCDGDDIRRVAGTVGTKSPLFKIKEREAAAFLDFESRTRSWKSMSTIHPTCPT